MQPEPSSLTTRWSIICRLHGPEHDASWEWFIGRYRSYVAAVLRRVGLPAHEIEAATASFWGYLFQSRATLRADRAGRFRSYLSGILRNFARSWRREHGLDAEADEAALAGLPDQDGAADLDLWAAQLVQLGLACLGGEQPEHEQILRWFYGIAAGADAGPAPRLGGGEIARRLGRSPNAVHQALFPARAGLRRCLEQEVALTVGAAPEQSLELELMLAAIDRLRPGLPYPETEQP